MAGATETTPDLEALSKAAGPLPTLRHAPWGIEPQNETEHNIYADEWEVTIAQGLPPDVARYIVALVNAFRAGDLIDRAAHEAAISEARAEERERCAESADAACDYIARNYNALTKCKTKYHPFWIQEIGKGFARLCREDAPKAIRALTDTPKEAADDQ